MVRPLIGESPSVAGAPPAAASAQLRRHRTGLILVTLLAALAWHPPHGLDIPICPTMNTFGLPCPGCGITRSMTCSLHGMWADAWQYHPWGPALLVYLVVALVATLVPSATGIGRTIAAARRLPVMRAIWYLGAAGFVAFGVVRAVWVLLTR